MLICTFFFVVCLAESKFMVSGAADNTLRLWSVQTGKNLFTWEFPTAVKRVSFNDDGTQVVCITEQRMGYQSAIRVFEINREGDGTDRESCFCIKCWSVPPFNSWLPESEEPLHFFNPIGSKATVCAFTDVPNIIFTGHESGKVSLFNVKTGEEKASNERAHGEVVTDLQMSKDRTYCVTSSKDKSARVSTRCYFFYLWFPMLRCCRYTIPKTSRLSRHSQQKHR